MKYTKPSLTFEQQADLLIKRGLGVPSRGDLVETLRGVSYYRLSGYWYPFKQSDDSLKPGTTLEKVWGLYTFDRQLRLLVMDAIERVEIAVFRTRMVELFTQKHGIFGYQNERNFKPEFSGTAHQKLMEQINDAAGRSKELFVKHFSNKYFSESHLPLWMVVETISFGNLFTFFRHLHRDEQRTLSQCFDLPSNVFENWLHALSYIRNLCAHHSRLWNRELAIRPMIPDKKHHPEFHIPHTPRNDRIYAVLILLRYMLLKVAPKSGWIDRLKNLLKERHGVPLKWMGFPDNWELCEFWKSQEGI